MRQALSSHYIVYWYDPFEAPTISIRLFDVLRLSYLIP